MDYLFFQAPKIYDLEIDEKLVIIWLFCAQCQAQGQPFLLNHILISEQLRLKKQRVLTIIEKLQQIQIVRCTGASKVLSFVPYITEHTEHTDTGDGWNCTEEMFNALYQEYPRKEGKTRGVQTLKRRIKNQSQFEALRRAVSNYAAHCLKNAIEKKYTKLFSTFANEWEDWADVEVEKRNPGIILSTEQTTG